VNDAQVPKDERASQSLTFREILIFSIGIIVGMSWLLAVMVLFS
jgi:hypothetical protein